MRNQWVFRSLLIIGIIANLAVVFSFGSEKKAALTVTSWTPYTTKEGGFSLKYPQGWKVTERSSHATEFEVKFRGSGDCYISALASLTGSLIMDIMKVGPGSKTQPLKVFHDGIVRGMEADLRNFTSDGSFPLKVAGTEAYGTTFTSSKSNGLMGQTMKGTIISTWNGENQISLFFVAPVKEYEAMSAIFGQFLLNFKPKPGPAG